MANIVTYADRHATITFVTGDAEMPTRRKPLTLIDSGKIVGRLHPVRDIRTLGVLRVSEGSAACLLLSPWGRSPVLCVCILPF